MSYEKHYTGVGYPTKREIEQSAVKRGFTHSFWASEYMGAYNGDTVVVYDTTDGMDEQMKQDAERYGKMIER